MSVELKPCPFCGGEARASKREIKFLGQNYIGQRKLRFGVQCICNRCKARGPLISATIITDNNCWVKTEKLKKDAIEAWNRRAET
jgi:Lar family restriction alleviation protein